MTKAEIKINSLTKELDKLHKSLERYTKILNKKETTSVKLNCNWTESEWYEHRDSATIEQRAAYIDLSISKDDVADTKKRLKNAEKRYLKAQNIYNSELLANTERQDLLEKTSTIESSWDSARKMTEEEKQQQYEKWLATFKAECLKDGITIETADSSYVIGATAAGKPFSLAINNGYTERSFYCYTLCIENETIFTSGTFLRAYSELMKRSL